MSNKPSKKPMPSQRVNNARDQAGRSRTIWIVAAVAAVVVFVLVVAIAVRGGSDDKTASTTDSTSKHASKKDRTDTTEGSGGSTTTDPTVVSGGDVDYGTVTVDGAVVPAMTASSPDAAIGATVPTITGQQFDGSEIVIGGPSSNGEPTIILGVAHWCPHCQKEVPLIQKWIDTNGLPAGVNLVAVSTSATDTRPNWPASDWLTKEDWTVPTLVDDEEGTAAIAIGLTGFPYMLVVDADGKVIYRTSGEKTVAEWEALLDVAVTGDASNA